MDSRPIAGRSLARPYHVNGDNLDRAYRNHLSDYPEWKATGEGLHADKWILREQNIGSRMSIDETALSKGELHTLLTNKDAHCKKGTIAAMVAGTDAREVTDVIMRAPEEVRNAVRLVTMDFSESMRCIVRTCFPNATIVVDLFHLIRLILCDLQDFRVNLKRKAKAEETASRKEFKRALNQHLLDCKANGTAPQMRANAAFRPEVMPNGDTLCELLSRSRYLLNYTRNEWSESQRKRAKILFERYPLLEIGYNLVHKLRQLFKSRNLTKAAAEVRLNEWLVEAENCGIDEFLATVQTIRERMDDVLNYFDDRETNASAESFNAKLKQFRAQLRGVNDHDFFLYRVSTLFG
mgnify:FL=1